MAYGKAIEVFLVNGTAESLVTAELSNWNGKAIKIPRIDVSSCKRDDIAGVGVYFLICQENDGTDSVYIGEAENVIDRLRQHLRDHQSGKELFYWNTAVVFVGNDLNKALIRYLENRFVELAKECGRYNILTKNTYKNTVLKESQIASMEEFVDNVKILINTLGYKVLVPAPKADSDTVYLYCKGAGALATGFVSAGGFTVLSGSTISDHTVPSLETRGASYYRLRNALINEGVIDNGTFVKDYEFSAPSAASAVVLGHTSNGNTDWKTKDGTQLKNLI
ncbi:MAG: GIY-YIG nuclease family protein [Paludibacteraceae bacterium]|nr:GIY-YIG nuclease family protein [Paludibacteraceae bacterium]